MPTYISHAIMAREVYDKLDNKSISLDYMLTYSLGGDLARFSKCRRTCHKVRMEEFIDNIWNYIKDNDLIDDSDYMGFLYGHICHYYMDMVCHPLIRKVDKISNRVKIKSHTLIESHIDAYLVRYKYDKDIGKFDTRFIFKGSVIKLYKIINYVYMKTYGVKCASFSYFITKFMYSKIRLLFIIFGKNLLKKLFYYDEYINKNEDLDIINDRKNIIYKNYLGNECNDSFIDLYNESIRLSIDRINSLK